MGDLWVFASDIQGFKESRTLRKKLCLNSTAYQEQAYEMHRDDVPIMLKFFSKYTERMRYLTGVLREIGCADAAQYNDALQELDRWAISNRIMCID